MRMLLCALVLITSAVLVSAAGRLDTVYEWKYVDYDWESDARRQQAIDSGEYDFSRLLPMDVDKAPDGRVFIAMLGMNGVPASLVTVTDKVGPSGPLVRPYPDWSYYKKGDCNSIQNVYRVAIDECERLWVLDTGFLEGTQIVCEPQLLAFDLKTDRLLQRIKIPNHIARGQDGQTLLATPIVETKGPNCKNTTVFMADPMGRGLVIWNGARLFRLENPVFDPIDDASNITAGNFTMTLGGGIVTMDLSPKIFPGEESFLYFHSLASFDLYAASSEVLSRSTQGMAIKFLGAKNVLPTQAVGIAFSSEGTLFMGLTSKDSALACWNRYRDLKPHNIEIVAQDSDRLQYANGMKVIRVPDSKDEEVWALTNRFVAFQLGQLDADDFNFRVLKGSVKQLIAGTACELPRKTQHALEHINKGEESVLIVTD